MALLHLCRRCCRQHDAQRLAQCRDGHWFCNQSGLQGGAALVQPVQHFLECAQLCVDIMLRVQSTILPQQCGLQLQNICIGQYVAQFGEKFKEHLSEHDGCAHASC